MSELESAARIFYELYLFYQVPMCKVIRFNIEYTIHYFEEEMIEVIVADVCVYVESMTSVC